MLGVHYTILKEQRFGKGKADDQGRQLARIPPLSVFCLLPSSFCLWDSEYYRLPVAISVGGAFQPSITFPFAQRSLRASLNACLKIGLANRSPLRVEDLLGTGFIWER